MMDQEQRDANQAILILYTLVSIMVVAQWGYWNKLIVVSNSFANYLVPSLKGQYASAYRICYVLVAAFTPYLFPVKIRQQRTILEKIVIVFITICFGIALIVGFSPSNSNYNLYIFPVVFICYTITIVYTMGLFVGRKVQAEKLIFGITNIKSKFFFEFKTEEGILRIHKPNQNVLIEGGPGSGKSESFIKPIIHQCAIRNYPGVIYDWEGDPTQDGHPLLSRYAYGCIEQYRKKGVCKLKFAFINFIDMSKTARVNVLSERYVRHGTESAFLRNLMTTLMKNLESSWKEKMDFWANNAVNYVYSIAYKCYKDREKGIGTLAHVIAFCLNDAFSVFGWLEEDDEIALNMAAMLSAWRLGADQQTAGAVSSAQIPLVLLNNKNIFWVLSPPPEEELDLDITNSNNPTLLCIGNTPTIREVTSPPISCILSVVMSQMNNPNKSPSVFLVDEFPTVNIYGIDTFSSTARKHHVATILALQDFNQGIRDYGERTAKVIKGNCGNLAYGMTNNDQTAKEVETLLGEKKELHESFSSQESGGGNSRTEQLQKEKVLQSRDIASQQAGHFFGKIANGNPPYFYTQFLLEDTPAKEIESFSFKVETGNETLDRKIMDRIVEQNYQNILDTVAHILAPYSKS